MARTKQQIRLRNVIDTRRYLSSLINRVENGDIESKEAGKLTYICNTLLKAQELECIEKRLFRLEEAAEKGEMIDVTPKPNRLQEGKS
jgi:hypothetical protein